MNLQLSEFTTTAASVNVLLTRKRGC